jgi:lipopolysaccharide/colanic/teichoic acid biosynthesis glycosyltransferase
VAKRAFDLIVSGAGLLVTAPIMLVIAGLIKLDSPGPVLYRGERVGRAGVPFRMCKFRTMVVNADRIGGASSADGDPRVTRMGRVLRKFKLDELPQLFNVFRGDMSLVGPRPEVPHYVAMLQGDERAILDVRPGITDFATIWNSDEGAVLARFADPERAYAELIRPTKIRLQLKYVREQSLWTDLSILWQTVAGVLVRRPPPALDALKGERHT